MSYIEAYIQSTVLRKTLECVSFDFRRNSDDKRLTFDELADNLLAYLESAGKIKATYFRRFASMGKRVDRTANRPLLKAEDGSLYGIITKSLGNNRFQIYCSDSITRIATIRGSMIKRVWMKEGDIVLVSLREGDGKFCDIEVKYNDKEIKILKEGGYITDQFLNQEDTTNVNVDFTSL